MRKCVCVFVHARARSMDAMRRLQQGKRVWGGGGGGDGETQRGWLRMGG